ncbi:diacylglycerol/lipid kinase family protein [bacterium]
MLYKIFYNPIVSGMRSKNNALTKLTKQLTKHKIQFEVVATTIDNTDEKELIKNIKKFKAIIVLGGDGTLNKTLTYLIKNKVSIPIGLLPCGTANVFAIEKKIPFKINAALKVILNHNVKLLDIGRAANRRKIYYFLLMAGIGFDAKAVFDVNPKIKKYTKKLAYILAGLKNFIKRPQKIEVELPLLKKKFPTTYVVITNSSYYAGKFKIAPDADMADGLFDMCLFKVKSNIEYLKSILHIVKKTHITKNHMMHIQTDKFMIRSKDKHPVYFQLDGEAIGTLPLRIEILHKHLPFLLP